MAAAPTMSQIDRPSSSPSDEEETNHSYLDFLKSKPQPKKGLPTVGELLISEETLHQMRSRVVQMDPLSKGVDDSTLKRFLRARDINVEKASKFFVEHQMWRRSFVPLGYIPEEQISNELKCKKVFLQGCDKRGRPLGVTIAHQHDSSKRDLEEFKRFLVYSFDKAISSITGEEEKLVLIADLEGWSYKNMDVRGYLAGLELLQDHYPERLGKVFMIHVPYVFWGAWKMVHPFIDKATREKIVFLENKKIMSVLKEEIGEEHLPEVFGGKKPLILIQDFPTSPK